MVQVAVVGSLSRDLVVKAPRLPLEGETIRGTDFGMFAGGKGNNQALAAARAGAETAMIGRVGRDDFGRSLIETLKASSVAHEHVIQDENVGTGIALIIVSDSGANSIVIAQQANLALSAGDVERARSVIETSKVLLTQLEISFDVVIKAAQIARQAGVMVALNPAPAPADGQIPEELLSLVDLFVPNQSEAELLTGIAVNDRKSAHDAALRIRDRGPKTVIITMGEHGAFLLESGDSEGVMIKPYQIDPVDSTAAGDAFCGAMAAHIGRGQSLVEATGFGCAAGALACTRLGAEPSLPRHDEIVALISKDSQAPAKLR